MPDRDLHHALGDALDLLETVLSSDPDMPSGKRDIEEASTWLESMRAELTGPRKVICLSEAEQDVVRTVLWTAQADGVFTGQPEEAIVQRLIRLMTP